MQCFLSGVPILSHPHNFSIGFPNELGLGSAQRSRTSQETSERSGARQVRSAGAKIYVLQINPMGVTSEFGKYRTVISINKLIYMKFLRQEFDVTKQQSQILQLIDYFAIKVR